MREHVDRALKNHTPLTRAIDKQKGLQSPGRKNAIHAEVTQKIMALPEATVDYLLFSQTPGEMITGMYPQLHRHILATLVDVCAGLPHIGNGEPTTAVRDRLEVTVEWYSEYKATKSIVWPTSALGGVTLPHPPVAPAGGAGGPQ